MPTTQSDAKLDFFKTEYGTSVDLIKHYDGREFEMLKFASGLTAAVPTVVFGFYGLKAPPAEYTWDFIIFISIVTALGLVSIFLAMVRTRLYFVYPARQANAIRVYFWSLDAAFAGRNDPENKLYKHVTFNPANTASGHVLQLLFVALQAALFFGWRPRHS